MTRREAAMENFLKGYNCSQSIVLAFEDILPIDRTTLSKLSSSFGGGMGRLREVCGSVSGMFMAAGLLYGYDGPETGQVKADHYARIQELARRFEEKHGSIVCRELLGLSVRHDSPVPEARTSEYYKKRPCAEIIGDAAEILEQYINEQGANYMTVSEYLKEIDRVNETGKYKPDWDSLSEHETPRWFKKDKFGIFIHFGVYSVPGYGNEWYSRNMYVEGTREFKHHVETYGPQRDFGYKDFIPMFKAENFDAKRWADIFEKSGAKYVVPVMEHHDGFAMYDTEFNKWNASLMGPKKNIGGELKDALEERGLVFCTSTHRAEHFFFMNGGRAFDSDVSDDNYRDFYGPAVLCPEWSGDKLGETTENPDTKGPDKEWLDDWLVRTAEIIDRYKPAMLYFDWWIHNKSFKPYLKRLAAYYYNRGVEWGREVTICYKHQAFPKDVATFDVERGALGDISPDYWQTDTAIGLHSWGYTKDNSFKSPYKLVCDLIDTVSKNGNFLLNIGPKPDGTFTKEEESALLEIGKWLKKNGEGIYGTTFWSWYKEGEHGVESGYFSDGSEVSYTSEDFRFTCKGGSVYAFCMKADSPVLNLKSFKKQPTRDYIVKDVRLLATGEKLSFERSADAMTVKLPAGFKDTMPVGIKIEFE